jgi:hypothetical protein
MIRAGLLACLLIPFPQEAAAELKPGLLGEFFELQGEVEDFPASTSDKKPTLRRIDSLVNFDATEAAFGGTGLTDKFFARWTGVLRIAVEGKYTLYTESDDGSRFYVSDVKVVDNGGLHAMEEKSGEIDLKPGDHPIRLELFDNVGPTGCRLSWEGPGIAKAIIPDKVLFHKKDKELDKD